MVAITPKSQYQRDLPGSLEVSPHHSSNMSAAVSHPLKISEQGIKTSKSMDAFKICTYFPVTSVFPLVLLNCTSFHN